MGHSHGTNPSINMDPICSGTFLMVSNENAIEAYVGMDIPREDAEIMTNPACKNKFEVEVCGNGIKWHESYPTLPKYNQTYNLKIGEAVTYTTPLALTIAVTKKNGRTFTFSYKRIPDIVGKWRMVTKHGVEAQLEALGMSGPEKAKAAANFIPTSVEGKALCGGRWKWESTPREIH